MSTRYQYIFCFFFVFFLQNAFANLNILLEEDFENCEIHSFTAVKGANDLNPMTAWSCANSGSNDYIQISGINNQLDDDWLISPPIDMTIYEDERFSFWYKNINEGQDITLLYSVDYDGSGTEIALALATWVDIPLNLYDIHKSPYVNNLLPHPAIDISGINGTAVYFAFRYENTVSEGETWQLDDIRITGDYYKNMEDLVDVGVNCSSFKTALAQLIRVHDKISYTSSSFDIWDAFYATDRRLNDTGQDSIVWDIYSDNPNGTEPYTFNFGEDQDIGGGASTEGIFYNREHVFPSSWWGGGTTATDTQYVDLHHIFPSDKVVNQMKSNYPLGETNLPSNTSMNGTKIGPNSNGIIYTGKVFEPIDDYKGDFARAYFYMGTRYQHKMPLWETIKVEGDAAMNGSTSTVFEDWLLQVLLTWHESDPVSEREIQRNEAIFSIQNNRNPFIDHPEYVDLIWGGADGTACNELALAIETSFVFELEQVGKDVHLTWETDIKTSKHFIIEHTIDGYNFKTIGMVDGVDFIQLGKQHYSYRHIAPAVGKHYYRLKWLDTNQQVHVSDVITIKTQDVFVNKIKAFVENGQLIFWRFEKDGKKVYMDVLGRKISHH